MKNALPEEWKILRNWLPERQTLITTARKHGFLTRVKGISDVETWLRLFLMHAAGGLSLEQTVMRSSELGIAKLSAVSLHNRLENAGEWLGAITERVLADNLARLGKCARGSMPENIIAVDASDIQQPASTGTDWRLHYCVNLATLKCEQLELTDKRGGERFGRFNFNPGQIVLADRGYCHRAGVAHLLEAGAEVVVRYASGSFPLLDAAGRPFDLLKKIRRLRVGKTSESKAWFSHENRSYPLRVCVLRVSKTAEEKAVKNTQRKANSAGRQLRQQTLDLCKYIVVLTSLPEPPWPAERVLELYRCRWQVELVFKRLKSLLFAGHVPKKNQNCARAWLQAKVLTALLIERALTEARFFSPWGYRMRECKSVDAI